MQDILLQNYEWLRALHIIAVISWMAGMLYLPRLFVYHVDAEKGSVQVFGLSMLLANPGMMSGAGWMHVKMLLVVLMSGVHGMFAAHVRRFANDENVKDAKFFRILNEAPTILMIIIVIMAVVQPF